MAKNLDYIEKRVLELESEVTEIHLRGTDLVPASKADYLRLDEIRKELEDITDGENTLIGNNAGQFEPAYTIEPKEGEQFLNYWSDELTGAPTSKTGDKQVLPCFARNNHARKKFHVNKYKMSAVYTNSGTSHTNYPVGLYNMSPAHSSGGFSVSYDGVVTKMDQVNSSTFPTYMPSSMQDWCGKKHLITWDEYAYLCLLAKKYAFEPLGDTNQCADTKGVMGEPADYSQFENDIYKVRMARNGSGPNYWRHNGKYTGIASLVGGCRTMLSGLKVKSGIIQIIDFTTTDGVLSAADLKDSGTLWKAISAPDGSLIDPSTVDGSTVKAYCIDFPTTPTANNSTVTMISDEILIRDGGFYGQVQAKNVAIKEGLASHYLIELAGYMPFKNGGLAGYQYLRNAENSSFVALVGGYWYYGGGAGLRCVYGNLGFGTASSNIGALLASD